MAIVQGMRGGESIEQFIDREIRPDTVFLQQSRRVVDTVVRFFQQCDDISVKNVIVGGSLGKGTGVKNKSDVDVLLVLNDFKDMGTFLSRVKNVTDILESYVRKKLTAALPNGAAFQFETTTPYSVQFQLKFYHGDTWHEVDVLPIPDVLSRGYDAFYNEMERSGRNQPHYAKCLTQLQVDFVKPKQAKLKDVIRFFKYWAKTNYVNIISYAIELIVIKTWEENGSPYDFSTKGMISAVAEKISQMERQKIAWNVNYNSSRYTAKENSPYMFDPADPFNDIMRGLNARGIAEHGRQLLSRLR